jgi:hypothetical protein
MREGALSGCGEEVMGRGVARDPTGDLGTDFLALVVG